jgi:plasmid stabilization system protein ParE
VKEFPRYLVFYCLHEGTIELLRVKHGMMHLPGLFETGTGEG